MAKKERIPEIVEYPEDGVKFDLYDAVRSFKRMLNRENLCGEYSRPLKVSFIKHLRGHHPKTWWGLGGLSGGVSVHHRMSFYDWVRRFENVDTRINIQINRINQSRREIVRLENSRGQMVQFNNI